MSLFQKYYCSFLTRQRLPIIFINDLSRSSLSLFSISIHSSLYFILLCVPVGLTSFIVVRSTFLCPYINYCLSPQTSITSPLLTPIIHVRAHVLLTQSFKKCCISIHSIILKYCVFVPPFINFIFFHSISIAFNRAYANSIPCCARQYM